MFLISEMEFSWQYCTHADGLTHEYFNYEGLNFAKKSFFFLRQASPATATQGVYRDIFLTLNIVHTYSLCSILKNTDQCIVSCYATKYTEHQRF
jgi:hypothetical protein